MNKLFCTLLFVIHTMPYLYASIRTAPKPTHAILPIKIVPKPTHVVLPNDMNGQTPDQKYKLLRKCIDVGTVESLEQAKSLVLNHRTPIDVRSYTAQNR